MRRIGNRFGMAAATGRDARRFPQMSYDATVDSRRRKAPSRKLTSEDQQLTRTGRQKLTSGGRDLRRNFPDAAWAIRKHLDFVSTFSFQARTGDDGLDEAIEERMNWRARPENMDLAARHPMRRFFRIAEACRTVDGDVFLLKLADGRMQGIEGDRVQTARNLPNGEDAERWTHGVKTSRGGRALTYCVCKRGGSIRRLELDRLYPARWIFPHGYYDRYDQVRGVTPLSTALNAFRDLYEGRGYALAKAKVAQLFGLTIYREASDAIGDITARDDDGDGQADAGGYDINFDKGPVLLDLDPGDRAEFLENKTPSGEFQKFDQAIVASALKSLDIPYSFYDESHTNFFGSKGALQQYLFSADIKREDMRQLLRDWTRWQLGLWVSSDELKLPRGRDFDSLRFEWIPTGLPWWKPLEEVKAYVEAIKNGLTSTARACKERGEDAYEIAAEEARYRIFRAKLNKEMESAGVKTGDDEPTDPEQNDTAGASVSIGRETDGDTPDGEDEK